MNYARSFQLPIGFKSNGKPAAIYHWNLPVLAKLFGASNSRSNSKRYKEKKVNLRHNDFDIADLIDMQHTPISDASNKWHENEALEKSSALSYNSITLHGADDDERAKILKKKSSPHYYAPIKKQKVSKHVFNNGKPKGFYVMKNSNEIKTFHNLID
jgi:hypothetical protein